MIPLRMSEMELATCHLALTMFGLLVKRGWEPLDAEAFIREAFVEAFPGTSFDMQMHNFAVST